MLEAVTTHDFTEKVLVAETPVLVDFWAPWCPPCRMLAPVLEQIADEYAGQLSVVKVNSDENPSLTQACGVRGVPTLLLYSGGEPMLTLVGARSKARLLSELGKVLALEPIRA